MVCKQRTALNVDLYCLHFPSAGITAMCHRTWLLYIIFTELGPLIKKKKALGHRIAKILKVPRIKLTERENTQDGRNVKI